jgi:exosortase A
MNKILFRLVGITKTHTKALVIAGIIFVVWIIIFHAGIISAARVWWVSEIYSHGFFILPITGYFIWRKKDQLAVLSPQPAYWAIFPLLFSSLIYILGVAGDISLFQHVGIFSILPLTIWLVYGTPIAKTILLPLVFILFSIPFGEEFIPLLQRVTADLSVWIVKLIDVPVFRNGLYIEIPNGRFIVAEACSGVRFFVGASVFGAIYAYVSYKSRMRQFVFFGISLIVPIIANSIRVSAIILIGYFSDMKYATGTDHIVYGWLFFAIVIILLITIGNLWADKPVSPNIVIAGENDQVKGVGWSNSRIAVTVGISMIMYISVFAWSEYINITKQNFIQLAKMTKGTLQNVQDEYWRPKFEDATESTYRIFNLENGNKVDYYSAYYKFNTPNTELISSVNRIYDPDGWTLKQKNSENITVGNDNIKALAYLLAGGNREYRIIIFWYEIGNLKTDNKLFVKLHQSVDALLGEPGSARVIIFSTTFKEDEGDAIKGKLIKLVRDVLNNRMM